MVLAGTPLSLGTIALPPLLLVLSSADRLHVLAEYYEAAENGGTPHDVVLHLLRSTGTPIVITAITTVVGFLSLVTNQIGSIRELGIYSSVGVLIAILLSLVVVPAVLAMLPLPKIEHGQYTPEAQPPPRRHRELRHREPPRAHRRHDRALPYSA